MPWSSKENSFDAEDYAERIGDRCGNAPVLTPGKSSEVIFGEFAEAEESRGDGTGNAEARDDPRKQRLTKTSWTVVSLSCSLSVGGRNTARCR